MTDQRPYGKFTSIVRAVSGPYSRCSKNTKGYRATGKAEKRPAQPGPTVSANSVTTRTSVAVKINRPATIRVDQPLDVVTGLTFLPRSRMQNKVVAIIATLRAVNLVGFI